MTFPTEEQRALIETDATRVLALAGPGSGKTTTLVARINADIAAGFDPMGMVAITFTNKAARHLKTKLGQEIGFVGTLHRFALYCLRTYGAQMGWNSKITVLDEETADGMLKGIAEAMQLKVPSLAELKRYKASGIDSSTPPLAMAATKYRNTLRQHSAVDFDTILTEFLRLIKRHLGKLGTLLKPLALYVDEYQDSAPIDAAIYDALEPTLLFVVGDPDQSMYGFRGARLANILELAGRPETKTLPLQGNFRCGPNICGAANGLILHNTKRLEKHTFSRTRGLDHVEVESYHNAHAEALGISGKITSLVVQSNAAESEIAVLCRYNHTAHKLREFLAGAGHSMATQTRPERPRNWAACVGAINALENPKNDFSAHAWLRYLVKDQARLIAEAQRAQKSKVELVFELRGINPSEGLWPSLRKAGIDEECLRFLEAAWTGTAADTVEAILSAALEETHHSPLGVQVLTIHAAKGMEWDHVIMAAQEQEQSPASKTGDDLEEERRIFYVGLTRARHSVTITHAAKRDNPWTNQSEAATPSQFIQEALA